MTDYTDLIARLRRACYLAFDDGTNDYVSAPEAAEALAALQEALHEANAYIADLTAENQSHFERIAALQAVLGQQTVKDVGQGG